MINDKFTVLKLIMSPSKVEERLSKLEAEVTQLKLSLLNSANTSKPWWENILGTFADDPSFEEAIAIGREYRRSYKDLFEPPEVE